MIVSKKMWECNEEGNCLPVSPAESLPTLTVAVARPRKRPREATILEAYMLIEVLELVKSVVEVFVCCLSCLCVGVSEDVVESRGGTTVFILLKTQQTA